MRLHRKSVPLLAVGVLVTLTGVVGLWRPWSRPLRTEAVAAHEDGEAHERGEEGEEHEKRGQITLSEEAMKSIKLAKAERRRMVRELSFTGEVTFHPDRVAVIGPKMSARIARISVGVGDRVTRGQVLATLDSAEFARARGTYIAALARRDAAQTAFDRQERLRADGINSVRDVEEARANLLAARAEIEAARGGLAALGIAAAGTGQATSSAMTLTSPIVGIVVRRDAIVGQTVEATASLFTIADLSEVWVLLDVYERDLGRVAAGAEAIITTSAYPDRTFEGRVAYLSEVLEERTRTAKVRVVMRNEDRALRPGMFCRATLRTEATAGPQAEPGRGEEHAEAGREGQERREAQEDVGHEALVVPPAALQRSADGDAVFVHTGDRTFQARPVRVGERAENLIEIRSGLREGEEVATDGSLTLKAELERESIGEGDED